MLTRLNAQIVIFIFIVGFVVFYYFNTAGQLEIFKNQFAASERTFHHESNEDEPHGSGPNSDRQQSGVEEFKAEIMKEAKIYVDWAISNSSDKTKIFLDKVEDKIEKHFERHPDIKSADFDKLTSAMKTYAKDFFHAELIPPGLRAHFSYFKPEIEYLNTLDQEDPILVEHVKKNLWLPGAPKEKPYILNNAHSQDHSEGQLKAFLDVYGSTNGGFFIECGGLDGEDFSNTLDLENRYNWTGVLIEAAPVSVEKILYKNRKSVTIPACLSLSTKPSTVKFAQLHGQGKIINASGIALGPYKAVGPQVEVHCIPFYTIYQAIGNTDVDLFSLDIEGHEMDVLHTIPFDKINIHTFMIEFINSKLYNRTYMRNYMDKKGYRMYKGPMIINWTYQNDYFIKRGSKYDRPAV